MMQNKLILAAGVGVILVIGAFFVLKQGNTNSSQVPLNKSQSKNTDSSSLTGTLKSLLSQNRPMECDFSYNDTDTATKTSGTVYLSGNKMRGNFTLSQETGQNFESYMIRDEKTGYTWSSLSKQGSKFTFPDEETLKNLEDQNQMEDPLSQIEDKDVEYDCKSWMPAQSFFTPPTDIEFVDLNEQLNQVKDLPQVKVNCEVCNQAPEGTAREQCKLSLGCQ